MAPASDEGAVEGGQGFIDVDRRVFSCPLDLLPDRVHVGACFPDDAAIRKPGDRLDTPLSRYTTVSTQAGCKQGLSLGFAERFGPQREIGRSAHAEGLAGQPV